MSKKFKRNMLLMTGLAGTLVATSAAGVALSSCSTTSSSSSSDVQYSYVIDWGNQALVDRLIIDSNGLVYSDSSMTTLIAVLPNVTLTSVRIPSSVKSISGYANVVTDATTGVKTYQSVGAFQNKDILETVILESGSNLQSIGGLAFSGCTNLKTISGLANSLTFVGANAFANCTNLTSVDLSNVLNIGDSAFLNCSSLNVSGIDKVVSIGDSAFNNAFAAENNTAITLSNVVTIGASAFNGSNIGSIDFSKNSSLKTIGQSAFASCTNLAGTLDFSNCSLLTTINANTFNGDTSLTTVYLPNESISNLTSIGASAFSGCTSLVTVAPSGSTGFVATSKIATIGANAFQNSLIKTIDLSTTTITNSDASLDNSFNNMHYVETVKVSNSLQQISMTMFNYVGDLGAGFDLVLPSTVTNFAVRSSGSAYSGGAMTYAPFANSGLKSIDMSKITSYDTNTTNSTPTSVNPGQFWNATKLETVILKEGTTRIWPRAFEGCANLKVVKEQDQEYTTGFVAKSTLTTIGANLFTSAITEGQDFPVDLSAMTFETSPTAFSNSNITSLKLPTTVTSIANDSFTNMTKLTSVNFEELTNLATIGNNNFSNTLLTNIDLSNTKLTSVGTSSFTGLPTNATASFPTTLSGAFSSIFTDTEGNSVALSFPNGINAGILAASYITSGVLQNFTNATGSVANILSNLGSLNLSNNTTVVNSIGVNTFFGSTKFSGLTLSASALDANSTLFTSAASITANTSKTGTVAVYTKANLPFGNNSAFTSLNYTGFTSTGSPTAATAQALFGTTNATTWAAVAKIINSLSNYTYVESDATTNSGENLPANVSSWTADTTQSGTSKVNADSEITFTAAAGSTAASISLTNTYTAAGATTSEALPITATTESATFIHNGILWTYTNNGTSITLTGGANMYKATNGSTSLLTFFNNDQVEVTPTGGTATTYNIPSQTKVNVTLTIATTSSSAS